MVWSRPGLHDLTPGLHAVEERELEVDAQGPVRPLGVHAHGRAAETAPARVGPLVAVSPREVQAGLVAGLGDLHELLVDLHAHGLAREFGAALEGHGQDLLVGGRLREGHIQGAGHVQIAGALGPGGTGAGRGSTCTRFVVRMRAGRAFSASTRAEQDVVVRGRAEVELLLGLVQVPLLLREVLLGDVHELLGEEDVVEGRGHVAPGGLLVEAELLLGAGDAHLGGLDGGPHLAPREEDLAQA